MEIEIPKSSKKCALSGREFAEGEVYYSVVLSAGEGFKRQDIGGKEWTGPPEGAVAVWKSQVPRRETQRTRMAPNEVLWKFFSELAATQSRPEMLYVLALLLLRRRILRPEEEAAPGDHSMLVCYSPRDEQTYRVAAVDLTEEQVQAVEQELDRLFQGA